MAEHLYAIHDFDPAWAALVRSAGKTAWCVSTHELGDDPNDPSGHDFGGRAAYSITSLARLNYSHHGHGTIPLPNRYNEFAARCANFVAASPGCNLWIIGNEPNLGGERPNGIAITPEQYARAFLLCRDAIKRVSSQHQVIVAAIAPYNIDSGPWITYWRQVLEWLEMLDGADGLALHCYGRGANPASIASEDKMEDSRVSAYYNGFRAYRDFLDAVPVSMRGLPVYITETDQNEPWIDANTGWVQAAYAEIDHHNSTPGTQPIKFLALYRWYKHDRWEFSSKQGVIDDFRMALAQGYKSPQIHAQNYSKQDDLFLPYLHNWSSSGVDHPASAPPTPGLPPRAISDDFKRRVPSVVAVVPEPGKRYYRLIQAEYVPDGARRFGPDHHILVDVLDANGNRQMGTPINFYWADGSDIVPINKVSEPYGADYGMTSAGQGFGVWVGNFREASDDVFGMGLGKIGSEQMGDHVTYYLVFQEVKVPETSQVQPIPQQPATVPDRQRAVGHLAHPVTDARYRLVTQHWAERADFYKQYSVDGVPLRGHNGIDFGTPIGTVIAAVDDGQVVEAANDPTGYGLYIKLQHTWGQSLYAHLSEQLAQLGETVSHGEFIGISGNTGNSSGPHLHLGLRIAPFDRRDGWGGYIDPAPYLPGASTPQPQPTLSGQALSNAELIRLIKAAAIEYGIDWQLLASLAWAESSWRANATSSAGAMGLTQLMPATWEEWSAKVGGTNPYDPAQNLRVGAAYLAWLIQQASAKYGSNATGLALIAYGWGIGNLLAGKQEPPQVWKTYAAKIIHGRDLLKAMGL